MREKISDIKKEKKENLSRRNAINKLAKMLILAACSGGAGIEAFQLKQKSGIKIGKVKLDLEKLKSIKAKAPEAKAIKVLIFNKPEIFRNVFGRPPIMNSMIDPHLDLGGGCKFFFAFDACSQPGCNGNTCGGQECGNLASCTGNNCDDQKCPNLSMCDGNNGKILSTENLNQIRNDPFIQELFHEFNVTTTVDLAKELKNYIYPTRFK